MLLLYLTKVMFTIIYYSKSLNVPANIFNTTRILNKTNKVVQYKLKNTIQCTTR